MTRQNSTGGQNFTRHRGGEKNAGDGASRGPFLHGRQTTPSARLREVSAAYERRRGGESDREQERER